MQTTADRPSPRPRNPGLPFDEVPRYWFGGSAAATHMANGVNLLFPAGERFFVRSVKRYLDRIDDPKLLADVKGFFGQEGRHANAHERFFDVMRAHGHDPDGFLKIYETIFARIEAAAPPELSLAVTVALEHFTAIMAENALAHGLLAEAHPAMRALLLWHAAEEIEHKAVAFDVLTRVNPSYRLRLAGLALGGAGLVAFWTAAALTLAAKDGMLFDGRFFASYRATKRRRGVEPSVFGRAIREYLRRDFHPSQNDNYALAAEHLAAAIA